MWYFSPDLNTERADASSCDHGDFIYIFGGLKSTAGYQLDTIERLNANLLTKGYDDVFWEVVQVSCAFGEPITSRESALMVSISDSKILILGGDGNSGF